MNKRQIHHYLDVLGRLKTWQLVVIALLLSAVSVALLRHNSIEAVRLFEAVKAADREGGDTTKALTNLQRYVSQHMNTQLERVSLEKRYQRDYQVVLEKAASSGTVNSPDYEAAQAACQAELARTGSFPAYAQCVSARVGGTAPGQNPELAANTPKPERYQYTFVSPVWSPDLAGIAVLVTGVIWLVISIKVGIQLLLMWLVRRQRQV